jgi:hypothetical protein
MAQMVSCSGSSPEKARCEAAKPQDRRDRTSSNQVVFRLGWKGLRSGVGARSMAEPVSIEPSTFGLRVGPKSPTGAALCRVGGSPRLDASESPKTHLPNSRRRRRTRAGQASASLAFFSSASLASFSLTILGGPPVATQAAVVVAAVFTEFAPK